MKKLLGLLLLCSLIAPAAYAAEVKIGVVDLQKAIAASKAGLESKAKLETEIKDFEQKAKEKFKELEKLRDALDKQTDMLSDDARAAKEKEFQQKSRDAQRFEEDRKNELRQLDSKLYNQLVQTFAGMAQDVAKKEGYDYVFERTSMIYAVDSADLTDKLIAEADARFAKKK